MILYLESPINKGTLDTKPAKIAPAPKNTNNAGNAQQSRVPKLVNRDKVGNKRLLVDMGFIVNQILFIPSTVYPASSNNDDIISSSMLASSCK